MMSILSFRDGLIVFAVIIYFLEILVYITYNDLFKIRIFGYALDQCTVPTAIKDLVCIQKVHYQKKYSPVCWM